MALSGIQIYKLLPQTNCKECGFPTCLAFAMKLAAKQVELSDCPYVSEESKTQLAESAAPPIRLISLKSNGYEVKVGNEVVLFRHEKTFYNKPGVFIKFSDDIPAEEIKARVEKADSFVVNYVGIDLTIDGFAMECLSGDADKFAAAVKAVRAASKRPLILLSQDPAAIESGLQSLDGEAPMIYGANADNWEKMAELAKSHKAVLGVTTTFLEEATDLTEQIKGKGVEDIVLGLSSKNLSTNLIQQTQIRKLALKKNYKPLGYPTITFPTSAAEAAQAITKYAGFLVLDSFTEDFVYPLLVLRQNIYTDPQKPIQVQPGIYEINNPKPEDPVLVTTNFSITYFSVANEVEGSGMPAWLLVTDAEGMSVLTAWAAGKFDAERIAKAVKSFDVADKVSRKRIVLPGAVAVLSGELEAELPDWEIRVGPREAVDIPKFMKLVLA
ncbi:MAG: acetyl-CoA decarbonylase/synthase complex subunit gamma [Anaerolineales bacterium]|nr:MAG: acetyl-CoA decarbonylase/synthase complex subunit gamma [Anaerolineales bacterium]